MSNIRIDTVEPPFDHPATAASAVRMLCRAESVGAFVPSERRSILDRALLADACRALSEQQIARDLAVRVLADDHGELDAEGYRGLLDGIFERLGDSPLPEGEWAHLLEVFPVDDLAALVHIAPASLRRYASQSPAGRRATPDAVAARVHLLALVVDGLAGGYNAFGIRRWFERVRAQLDGHAPRDLLRGDWRPEDDGPQRVLQLAEQLLTAGAT